MYAGQRSIAPEAAKQQLRRQRNAVTVSTTENTPDDETTTTENTPDYANTTTENTPDDETTTTESPADYENTTTASGAKPTLTSEPSERSDSPVVSWTRSSRSFSSWTAYSV